MRTLKQALQDRKAEREREAAEQWQRERAREAEIQLHERVVARQWTERLGDQYGVGPAELDVAAPFDEDECIFWIRVNYDKGHAAYQRPLIYFQDTGELEELDRIEDHIFPDAWTAHVNPDHKQNGFDNLLDALAYIQEWQDCPF